MNSQSEERTKQRMEARPTYVNRHYLDRGVTKTKLGDSVSISVMITIEV